LIGAAYPTKIFHNGSSMDEQNAPASLWQKIKKILWINGTKKGEMQLKEFRQILMVLITLAFFGAELAFLWNIAAKSGVIDSATSTDFDKNIAVLTIDEEITDAYANTIIEKLETIRGKKESFPYLLVVMASPGGSPSGSSEIAHYLHDLQSEMEVTMYIQSMAASGGYYIAASIDHNRSNPLSGIIAQENAIVGSIGVIMPKYVFKDLAQKVGIGEDDITVGKYKKPLSLFKYSTTEEKAYLRQNLLNPAYKNFINYVAKGRHISPDTLHDYAEGKIFIATEVVGPLVDRISYISQVKREIKTRLEREYPGASVGFSPIGLKKSKLPFFGLELNVENLHLGAEAQTLLQSNQPSLR
jgi:protease-4